LSIQADLPSGSQQPRPGASQARTAGPDSPDERRYRLLFETMDEGVIYCDSRGALIALNPKALQTFGIPQEQAIGRTWGEVALDVVDEAGGPIGVDQRPMMLALKTGRELRNFVMGVVSRRDGLRRWIKIQAVPLFRPGEREPYEAYSIFTDITEDREKRHRLELLRSISDSSTDLIFAKDRSYRITFANPAFLQLLGKSEAEVLGRTEAQLHENDETARVIMEHDRLVMQTGEPAVVEEVIAFPDGSLRYFRSKKSPYRDAGGNVIGLLGISREVTDWKVVSRERVKLHEALQAAAIESERNRKQLEAVFQAMSDGVIVFDMSGKVVLVNRAQAKVTGYAEEAGSVYDIAQMSRLLDVALPDGTVLPFSQWPVSRVLRGESFSQWEVLVRRKGIDRTWIFSFSGEPVRNAQGEQILGLTISRDITAAKRTEDALKEADRRKDEFMSILSHELRNPLAPLRNASYILDHCVPDSEEAVRARRTIDRQVGHLSRLVDDLLDVTRIARGKAELKLQTLDLRQVVRQLTEDHREVVAAWGLRCEMHLPDQPVWIRGDATRLAQVLGNLVQNAIKFTAPPGLIDIDLATAAEYATVRVRDTGSGIEPALIGGIFEPFMQGPQELARGGGGLGLGLALVKGFTELHGGRVRVHSEGPGKGTEFVLEFPLAAPEPAPQGAAGPHGSAIRKRVLVVDDNRDAADTLAGIVRLFGHEPYVAYDGPETLRLAREKHPDVILCDIGLPRMDGYEVAKTLRADPALADIRLVALSGYAQAEDRNRSRESGFDAHIAKPASAEDIEKAIR
jgi:PAS domain S-box-containing protein